MTDSEIAGGSKSPNASGEIACTQNELDKIRELASVQAWTPQRVIEKLGGLDLFDHRFRKYCLTMRDQLVPALKLALETSDAQKQLQAGILLLHLGEADGTSGLISSLRDEQIRTHALVDIGLLPLFPLKADRKGWQVQPVPIERMDMFDSVKPLLESSEIRQRELALDILLKLDVPDSLAVALATLRQADPPAQVKAIQWLAEHDQDEGGLDVAERLLLYAPSDFHRQYWLISALVDYCRGPNLGLTLRAANILSRYIVSASANNSDNDTSNLVHNALEGLSVARPSEARNALEAVLRSSLQGWVRGEAINRLAILGDRSELIRLRAALKDEALRESAAAGLARLAKPTKDMGVISDLLAAARVEKHKAPLGKIVQALAAAGASTTELYAEFSSRLEPHDAMRLFWLANGIIPKVAADKLVAAGAMAQPELTRMAEIEEEWRLRMLPVRTIFDLLDSSQKILWFDCEASDVPPDYVDLLSDLAALGRNVFVIDALSQQQDSATGNNHIHYICRDKAYQIIARDFGDWYDSARVLGALNQTLQDINLEERFVQLYTGDQAILVAFAPEQAFRQVAAELRLPLEADASSAMKSGMAYEALVIRNIQGN